MALTYHMVGHIAGSDHPLLFAHADRAAKRRERGAASARVVHLRHRQDRSNGYDAAMGEDLPGFRFRELAPDDGPGVASLFDASPDTGMIRFRPTFQIDPYAALTYDERQTGVVVERDGSPGLVGLGLV